MSAIYAKDGGYHGVRVNFDEAEILPFHATSSGLALLAFNDDTLANKVLSKKLISFTDSTSTDAEDIKANLETIRAHGFAFTDQSYEDEVGSVAVPFFGVKGDAIGTLAIAIPVSRINKSFHETIIKQLIVASTELCRDLGGQIPTNVATIWASKLEV
jgi:DNA-binding IclR family transcriptional regulator